jgi:hypothetical protein
MLLPHKKGFCMCRSNSWYSLGNQWYVCMKCGRVISKTGIRKKTKDYEDLIKEDYNVLYR